MAIDRVRRKNEDDERVQRYGRAIALAVDEDYMEDYKQYDRQARAVLKIVDEEIATACPKKITDQLTPEEQRLAQASDDRDDRAMGGDANRLGKDRGANPFVGTPARYLMWQEGWDTAEREKAENARVLLRCQDCGGKSSSARVLVDRYVNQPGWTMLQCPKCESTLLEEVK